MYTYIEDRKTQYDNYEDYFQVFRGFSKKSYPDIEDQYEKKSLIWPKDLNYHLVASFNFTFVYLM